MAKIIVERSGYKYSIDENDIGPDGEFLVPPELAEESGKTIKVVTDKLLLNLSAAVLSDVLAVLKTDNTFGMFFGRASIEVNADGRDKIKLVIDASTLQDASKAELKAELDAYTEAL